MNEKDWVGNSNSMFTTVGASNHVDSDRATDDFYATDPDVIPPLFQRERFTSGKIWEPACGAGHLSEAIKSCLRNNSSYPLSKVYSTDIANRGYKSWDGYLDFLKHNVSWPGDIITNPPYKYALEFVNKSLELIYSNDKPGLKIAMFLKLTFLEGQKRKRLFTKYPPKHLYVFSERQKCAPNGDFSKISSSAIAYTWFVWEKDIIDPTKIYWI